jgi:hypothetical protein
MCIYIAKLTQQFPNSCWKIIIREAEYSNGNGPSYSMRGPSHECRIFAHRFSRKCRHIFLVVEGQISYQLTHLVLRKFLLTYLSPISSFYLKE